MLCGRGLSVCRVYWPGTVRRCSGARGSRAESWLAGSGLVEMVVVVVVFMVVMMLVPLNHLGQPSFIEEHTG